MKLLSKIIFLFLLASIYPVRSEVTLINIWTVGIPELDGCGNEVYADTGERVRDWAKRRMRQVLDQNPKYPERTKLRRLKVDVGEGNCISRVQAYLEAMDYAVWENNLYYRNGLTHKPYNVSQVFRNVNFSLREKE